MVNNSIDLKEIENQVKRVIEYSQDINDPKVHNLISDWFDAKRDFIELFGGKLIVTYPDKVSFELGPKEKNLRINDFLDLVQGRYNNYPLSVFIDNNRDGFFNNVVVCGDPEKGIPKGMKLIRAFKFFESDKSILNELQSAASMIIQEDKIEGTLCLSVHPLDYLSSSENTHNWRSCHSLDGDYRSGNLSYMVDSSTIVCYLKSDKPEKLPNFPPDVLWNSKKWRTLLFLSNDWKLIFAGRQYPFTTTTGIDFVKDNFLTRIGFGNFSKWSDKQIKDLTDPTSGLEYYFKDKYIPVGNTLRPIKEVVVNKKGSLMFNDLLDSSCYIPMYAHKVYSNPFGIKIYEDGESSVVHIGGAVKCMCCGKENIEITESMMCNDCELKYGNCEDDMFCHCAKCGERMYYDDGIYVSDDEDIICPDCAEEYTECCPCCGERYYSTKMRYSRKYDNIFCYHCLEDMEE